ncbi:unnamed protein product, partial [Porites lobata]
SHLTYGTSSELYSRLLALHLPTVQNVCSCWGLVHHWSFHELLCCCLYTNLSTVQLLD